MASLWRNWPVHNLIAHPLSEIVYWIVVVGTFSKERAMNYSGAIHDCTIPKHTPGQGRG